MTFLDKEIALQEDIIVATAEKVRGTVSQNGLLAAIGQPSNIVVTGCGDSLFAAELIESMAIETGCANVRAFEALELSRYAYRALDKETLVIALSYGGETVRVLEAVRAARSRGSRTIVLTRDRSRPMGVLADAAIEYPPFEERSNTRTISFQAAIVASVELIRALPGVGFDSHPDVAWHEVTRWVRDLRASAQPVLPRYVSSLGLDRVDELLLIGAGPSLVAARYGAAKAYEAATVRARAVELEEFCHCEIFAVTNGTPIVLIAPPGASIDRAGEVANALNRLGCRVLVLTAAEAGVSADVTIELADRMPERFTPMVVAPALQMLAALLALQRHDDADVVRNKAINSPLIRQCPSWEDDTYEQRERDME